MGIESLLFFILIGAVVSLDVCGLTVSRTETYFMSARSAVHWSFRNAFWHSALLFGYAIFAIGIIDLSILPLLDWLASLQFDWPLGKKILIELHNHFAVIFSVFVIAMIWKSYKKKLIENPLDEDTDLDAQRSIIKRVLETIGLNPESITRNMQAVAVAVDMLALSFLLKALDKFDNIWVISEITLVIFITVFFLVLGVTFKARSAFGGVVSDGDENISKKRKQLRQILFTLRLLEPTLIFFFVCELITFVVWGRMHSSSLFFLGASGLTFALVKTVGLANLVDTTDAMVDALIPKARDDE